MRDSKMGVVLVQPDEGMIKGGRGPKAIMTLLQKNCSRMAGMLG